MTWVAEELNGMVGICFDDEETGFELLVADMKCIWHDDMEGGSKEIADDICRILNHQDYDPRLKYEWEEP